MKPIYHFVSSLVLAGLIFYFSQSFLAALIAFLAGFLIDLDHLIDFWASKPNNPLSIKQFLNSKKYFKTNKRNFILFHAWEYVVFLIILGFYLNWPLLLLSLVLGLSLHYLLDIYNLKNDQISPFSYLLTFRLIKGFKIHGSF